MPFCVSLQILSWKSRHQYCISLSSVLKVICCEIRVSGMLLKAICHNSDLLIAYFQGHHSQIGIVELLITPSQHKAMPYR